jgi:hypothetical protein
MNKTYTEAEIRHKLATDERWVRRALIRLYERQTQQEQSAESTQNHNCKGFAPCDAKWFSRLAVFVTKYPSKQLTPNQLALVWRPFKNQPAISKYAGQLMKVMAEDARMRNLVKPFVPTTKPTCTRCGEEMPGCKCERKALDVKFEQMMEERAFMQEMMYS